MAYRGDIPTLAYFGQRDVHAGVPMIAFFDKEASEIIYVRAAAVRAARADEVDDLSDAECDHMPDARRVVEDPRRYHEIPRWQTNWEEGKPLPETLVEEVIRWLRSLGLEPVDDGRRPNM